MSADLNNNNSFDIKSEISAKDTFDILQKDPTSILVDVRTDFEWQNIGEADLSPINKETLNISWKLYPDMKLNENFLNELSEKVKNKDSNIFFMCKLGGRSYEAAVTAARNGFSNCHNVLAGFEGISEDGQIKGWVAEGLPIKKGR